MVTEYFEGYLNEKIRDKSLDFAEAEGIQKVFDFIEGGKAIADASYDAIKKYENVPE